MRQHLNMAVAAVGGRNQLKKMYPQLKPSSVNRIINSLEGQMEGNVGYDVARLTSEISMRAMMEENKINRMLKEIGTALPSLLKHKRPTRVKKARGLSSMSGLLSALPKTIQKKK